MNIYLAGCEGVEFNKPELIPLLSKNRLVSFFYLKSDRLRNLYTSPEYNIMLDSGAFSAFTLKKKIRIVDYIRFIKSQETIKVYYNLDVIGDERLTWRNQNHMEAAGLHPLPVFHMGESFESLRKCLEYDYFAIGGLVGGDARSLCKWLDKVFKFIGPNPRNKIHALGVTSDLVLRRYPWFSCDSTSWLVVSAMGKILIPKKKKGEFDFSEINPVHCLKTFKSDQILQPLVDYYRENLNFPDLDISDYSHRYLVNAFYFRQYEKTFNKEI